MGTFVGVGHPLLICSPGALKRAALLFDQISLGGVELMDTIGSLAGNTELERQLREFHWLVESNVIAPIPKPPLDPTDRENTYGHYSLDEVFTILLELAKSDPQHLRSYFPDDTWRDIQDRTADEAARDARLDNVARKAAHALRQTYGWDTAVFGLRSQLQPELLTAGVDIVIRIVLSEFPEPDDSTPWETIIDFRQDPDARGKFLRLKRWLTSVASDDRRASEIQDELHEALFEYEEHMKIHNIKARTGVLETVLTTIGDVAEKIIKVAWGDAARALFQVRQHRVALYEAERNAPGRHVAYILGARRRFDHPTA